MSTVHTERNTILLRCCLALAIQGVRCHSTVLEADVGTTTAVFIIIYTFCAVLQGTSPCLALHVRCARHIGVQLRRAHSLKRPAHVKNED